MFLTQLTGLFLDLLRGAGIATARLNTLDAGAERLGLLACRRVGVIARLELDRVDGVAELPLSAELIE